MKVIKNSWLRILVLSCGVFLLDGCATQPMKHVDSTIVSNSSYSNSAVYLIDDSNYLVGEGGVTILLNKMVLAELEHHGFKKVHIKPGSYTLSIAPYVEKNFVKKSAFLDLVAEANKTYYIVGGVSGTKSWAFPFGGFPFNIKEITKEEAEELMKKGK